MIKAVFIIVIAFSVVPCVFSIPLEDLIPAERKTQLLLNSGENISVIEIQLKNPSLKLMPQNNELRQYVTKAAETLNPNLMIETLYLYPKPQHSHTPPDNWNEAQRTGLYNQFLAISSLTGIQYFSASRGVMRTFFEFSYMVESPNNKNPLPDPFFPNPPAEFSLYARQKDMTFGDNIYKYNYIFTPNVVIYTHENMTSLSLAFIPVIGRNNLQSVMAVIDCGDSLLIYAVSMVKAASFPGMQERIQNSLVNRANALLEWLIGRANMVFL